MKTIDEMIAVMQAYKDGKTVETKLADTDEEWIAIKNPTWSWYRSDYRVKPEKKYVPYDSVLEIERDKWVKLKKSGEGMLHRIYMIDFINNLVYVTGCGYITMDYLFERFEYEYGTPCGKLVEE